MCSLWFLSFVHIFLNRYFTFCRNLPNVLTLVPCFWTVWGVLSLCEFVSILRPAWRAFTRVSILLFSKYSIILSERFQVGDHFLHLLSIVNSQWSMSRCFDYLIQKGGFLLWLSKLSLGIPAPLLPLYPSFTCHPSHLFSIRSDSSLSFASSWKVPWPFLWNSDHFLIYP